MTEEEIQQAFQDMVSHVTDIGESVQKMTAILVKVSGVEAVQADQVAAQQAPSPSMDLNKIIADRLTQHNKLMTTFMEESMKAVQGNNRRAS